MARLGTIYVNSPAENQDQPESKEKKEIKKLDKLAEESGDTIYELSSVFPFQLFPDKIIIDKNKVTIIRKELFFKRTFPMLVKDIKTVKVNRSILFASIEFEIRGYETNPSSTNYLRPDEATKAKQYILGLISASREKVDLSKVPTKKAKRRLKEIGKAQEETGGLF